MAPEAKRAEFRSPGEEGPGSAPSALVTIQPGSGSKPALFCVHAEAGDVSLYYGLAGYLPGDQAMLGLCAPAPEEHQPPATLEQMAARHVDEIRRAQPEGPYLILGECTGGALAYEIAQQLRAADQELALLALIDSFPPRLPRLASYMPRPAYRIIHRARILGFHFRKLVRLGRREKLDYVSSRVQRVGGKLLGRRAARRRSAGAVSSELIFRQAFDAYDPRPYPGSMVLLRAASMPLGGQVPPDMGWAGLVAEIQIETIPGYFTTPISEPEVRTLATRLAAYLRP